MRLSRSMLSLPITLLGPPLVLALGITGGCQPYAAKPPKTTGHSKTVDCVTTINVNPAAPHGVDQDAVYVCDGDQVSWAATSANVTFTVQFPSTAPADCPFTSCPASITNNTPKQTVAHQPNNAFTVFKYNITVTVGSSSKSYDPHVVTGGGY